MWAVIPTHLRLNAQNAGQHFADEVNKF